MIEKDSYFEHLEDGGVLQFSFPQQRCMYFRKVSDVGPHAYEVEHPSSNTFVYGALEGRVYMYGIIETNVASINEKLSLEEAKDRGVFTDEKEDIKRQ